jgi:hypothetical protein
MAVEPRWSRRGNRERDRAHSELPYILLLDTGALHIDTNQSWVNILFLFYLKAPVDQDAYCPGDLSQNYKFPPSSRRQQTTTLS